MPSLSSTNNNPYRDLNSRANQQPAHYLQTSSIGPGTLVVICLERSLDMIISILAVLKAGGGYVPLDPTYPQERLAFMLRDAQVHILITRHMENLPDYRIACSFAGLSLEIINEESTTNPVSEVTSRDIAYVIYTSGSTGFPKGVTIEHYGLCNMLQEQIRILSTLSPDIQPPGMDGARGYKSLGRPLRKLPRTQEER